MQNQNSDPNYLPVYTQQATFEGDYLPEGGPGFPAYGPEPVLEESQFKELLNLLYAGRWFIIGAFLLVLAATALYTYTRVPVYRADSLVLLDKRLAPDLKDALEDRPHANGSSSRSVDTEVYVLQRSLGVARRVSARMQELGRDPETGNALPLLASGLGIDHLAEVIQYQIEVSREPVEDVLRISAISVDPGEARLLADLYAAEFVEHALGRSRSRLAATRFFLENEAGKRQDELNALEEQMRQFMAQNRGITLADGTANLVSQVAELEALRDEILLEARMKQVVREDLLRSIQSMQPQLASHVSANVPAKIATIQETIAEEEGALEQIYRRNPELRNVVGAGQPAEIISHQNEIARLQGELIDLTEQYIQQVVAFGEASAESPEGTLAAFGRLRRELASEDIEIGRLNARVAVVNKHLATFQLQLDGLPAQTIRLTQLQRQINTTERAYLLLSEKLEDVRISEESEQGYAEIVRKAALPFQPEFPNKPKNMILGGLVGLLLGLGLAVVRQQFYKNTLVTPDDVRKLGYALIGVIPSMRDFVKQQYRGVKLVEHNGFLNDSCLISLQPASSFVVDAYRRVRMNILGVQGDAAVQSVLVTSPNPEEGKSITALNLAIASAQAGQRTVIVDTDLRRPSIHAKLGIEAEPGITHMINERKLQFRKALGHVDNLYVLTAGAPTDDAADVIASREMPQLIHELKRLFDMVVLDSPPFMLVSDPLMLSAMCDGTVIVASAGKTRAEDLHQGMHELQKTGGHVLGVLLNEFNPAGLYSTRTKYKYYRYTNHYSRQNKADVMLQS